MIFYEILSSDNILGQFSQDKFLVSLMLAFMEIVLLNMAKKNTISQDKAICVKHFCST